MISLLVAIKRALPGLWNVAERINGFLFRLRWRNISHIASEVLRDTAPEGVEFSLVSKQDLAALSSFLESQPEDSFRFFRPHLFDVRTLSRLFHNDSFIMMKSVDTEGRMTGYFFLRCFFIRVAFAGLIVDKGHWNRGIGRSMWASCMEICRRSRLRMFATIADENYPSLKSCGHGTSMKVRKQMSKGYSLIECKSK